MHAGHQMASSYMEHGLCLNWEKPLVALHVGSDLVTGIAYYSIPVAMFYFAYRRRDLPFIKIFAMFAIFIFSCGTTHFLAAYTIFRPEYWAEGYVKAFTAAFSALTALIFIPRMPKALALPDVLANLAEIKILNSQLRAKNVELQIADFFIENFHDPVYWIAPDAKILRVNAAACAALGYTGAEMLSFTMADVDPHFPLENWPDHWESLKAKGALTLETQHRAKDGSLLDVEVSAKYISFGGQELNCAIVRDLAPRKRVERELRANEQRLARLCEISQFPFTSEQEFLAHALDEVIKLTGSKLGYINFYNEQSREFTLSCWSRGVILECTGLGQGPDYRHDSSGLWGESVRCRKPVLLNDFQADPQLKKGCPDRHLGLVRFLSVPVIIDDAVVAVVGVANKEGDYTDTDVTQLGLFMDSVWMITLRKRADADRIRLEKQLLHAQKLESLGVLAGGIAHDFNNILVAILGNADLALMKLAPESPVTENLQAIEKAAARAADLARQMLAYSGKGRFVVEALDLNRLLEELLHLLKISISKKAELHFHPGRNLPAVEADATQLRQVVMNLVINASEAIGNQEGVITINTGCVVCDRAYLKEVWQDEELAAGTYVRLEVSDSGCGMDAETVAKIFDPFFTTKFTGRGLGMAAVLGIVRGHKGTIRVYSEPGKGTCFKLLFPASGRPETLPAGDSSDATWRGSGTVLLVDDEEAVLATGGKMLRELGFEVVTACDGEQAVERFKSCNDIKFVLLDLTMPHMDGEQCFRTLRALDPGVRVIMSSGYNEQDVTPRFAGRGLAGFIQKPYKLSELKGVIMSMEPQNDAGPPGKN